MYNKLEKVKSDNPLYYGLTDDQILNERYNKYYKDKVSFEDYKSKMTTPMTAQQINNEALTNYYKTTNKELTEQDLNEFEKYKYENMDSKNFIDGIKEMDLIDFIPIVGSLKEGFDIKKTRNVIEKAYNGGELNEDEVNIFNDIITKTKEDTFRETTNGYQISSNIAGSMAFMGEFVVSGALLSGLSRVPGVGKTIGKLLSSVPAKKSIASVGKQLGVAGGVAMAKSVLSPTSTFRAYQARQLEGILNISEEGEVFFSQAEKDNQFNLKNIIKATGDVFVSYYTEGAGGIIGNSIGLNKLISKVAPIVDNISSKVFQSNTKNVMNKLGWDGFIEEIFEEWLEKPLRQTLGLEDNEYTMDNFLNSLKMSMDEFVVTSSLIAIQGGMSYGASALFNKAVNSKQQPMESLKTINTMSPKEVDKALLDISTIETEQEKAEYDQSIQILKQDILKNSKEFKTEEEVDSIVSLYENMYLRYALDSNVSRKSIMNKNIISVSKGKDNTKRGEINFSKLENNYKSVINLFSGENKSTLLHETGHYFMRLTNILAEEGSFLAKEDMDSINRMVNKKQKGEYTQQQEEMFTRNFEAYLRRGIAPNENMKGVFDKFKQWLSDVYSSVKDLKVNLNKDTINFFDSFITSEFDIKANNLKKRRKIEEIYDKIENEKISQLNQDIPIEEAEENANNKFKKELETAEELQRELDEEVVSEEIKEEELTDKEELKQEQYRQNAVVLKNEYKNRNKTLSKNFFQGSANVVESLIYNIDMKAKDINENFYYKYKSYISDYQVSLSDYAKEISPFVDILEKYKKDMNKNKDPENKYATIDLALKNGDFETIHNTLTQEEIKEFEKVREILEEIRTNLIGAGVEIPYRENYFPRIIDYSKKIDFFDLLNTTYNNSLQKILNKEADKIGRELTEEEEINIANSYLAGFYPEYAITASTSAGKERRIEELTAEYNQYYLPSEKSLLTYIQTNLSVIKKREFLGRENQELVKLRRQLKQRQTTLLKTEKKDPEVVKREELIKYQYSYLYKEEVLLNILKKDGTYQEIEEQKKIVKDIKDVVFKGYNTSAESFKEYVLEKRKQAINDLKKEINEIQNDTLENSIGAFVKDIPNLSLKQLEELKVILKYMLSHKPSSVVSKTLSSISYGTLLTKFVSAVKQLADIPLLYFKFSPDIATRSIVDRFTKKDIVKSKEVGATSEIETMLTSGEVYGLVDKLLTSTGLKWIDLLTKDTYINASLLNVKKLLKNNDSEIIKDIENLFPNSFEIVKEDILKGNMTKEVKQYLFVKASEVFLIDPSSRPRAYHNNPHTRFLFIFKSFVIHRLNFLIKETKDEIDRKATNKAEAITTTIKVLAKYQAALTIAGFPVTLLVNLINGVEDDENLFTESILDTLFLFQFISRYSFNQVSREGVGSAIEDIILSLSALSVADGFTKAMFDFFSGDIDKGIDRLLNYVPYGDIIKLTTNNE